MSQLDMRKGYDPVTIEIYDRKKDILYKEISLIAFDKSKGKIAATGYEASGLIESPGEDIVVLSPLKNGAIADYMAARKMFQQMLKKVSLLPAVIKPRIAVSVPLEMTEVELKAYEDVFTQTGAKEVLLSGDPAEKLNLELPASFGIVIGIIGNQNSGQERKEIWREACIGAIPPDRYEFVSVSRDETGLTVALCGSGDLVKISFHKAAALRMLDKTSIPDHLYSVDELVKFREGKFQNVIYEITGGEFNSFLDNGRGKAGKLNIKHYILMSENQSVEILAEGYPQVIV